MPEQVVTLVRDAAAQRMHLLLTERLAVRWRHDAALCGATPPEIGWLAHHTAALGELCPACTEALAACRRALAGPPL